MPVSKSKKIECPERIFIELTGECSLGCNGCERPGVKCEDHIDTIEWKDIIDDLAGYGASTVVFTGGDPFVRSDAAELAFYSSFQGIDVIFETNGTTINAAKAQEIKKSGVSRVDISIDGSNAEKHDTSRGVDGYFTRALNGFQALRNVGIKTGFNTTVTNKNSEDLKSIIELAERLGAKAFNIFLMLPGSSCSRINEKDLMEPEKCRELMEWLWNVSQKSNMDVRVLCSPQYVKVIESDGRDTSSFGYSNCPAGIDMAYISQSGDVTPCPHIDISYGNLRRKSFKTIWEKNKDLIKLRDSDSMRGDCDACEVNMECSGCRSEPFLKNTDLESEQNTSCAVYGKSTAK